MYDCPERGVNKVGMYHGRERKSRTDLAESGRTQGGGVNLPDTHVHLVKDLDFARLESKIGERVISIHVQGRKTKSLNSSVCSTPRRR